MKEYKEGFWFREGSLLYTVRPCIFAGRPSWENDVIVRVEPSGSVANNQAEVVIEKLLAFLNEGI